MPDSNFMVVELAGCITDDDSALVSNGIANSMAL